jgi:hypothetical protein
MDNPTQDPVAEGKPPTQESLPAPTADNSDAQVNVSRETLEVKVTTNEQTTSLKDYSVRYYPSYGALVHDVVRC